MWMQIGMEGNAMIFRGKKLPDFETFVFYGVIFAGVGFMALYLIVPLVKGWFE